MNKTTNKIYILNISSLILGIIFDQLFFEKFIGISVSIFTSLIIAVIVLFSIQLKASFRQAVWVMLIAMFFSAMVAIRANMFLTALNNLATIGLLLLTARVLLNDKLKNFYIKDYFVTIFLTPLLMIERGFNAFSIILKPTKNNSTDKWKLVLKGILMALPFLLFFGVLFVSADLAFENFLSSIFHISDNFFAHLIIIVCISFACLGLLAFIFNPNHKLGILTFLFNQNHKTEKTIENSEKKITDRKIETMFFLWLIASLFFIFIVFQIAYLFGGSINIGSNGFTYAEYARRGFWELFVVAIVTLLILLSMDFYTGRSEKRLSWFTIPSLVITAEIFIIIISALKRLMLYESAYGWTTLRLYAAGFIILLSYVFIILAIKLWSEKKNSFFAFGLLWAMITFLFCFNILNPDRFIVQQNIQRFNETGNIDINYLGTMSADATIDILSIYDRFNETDKKYLLKKLSEQKIQLEKDTKYWQSYNYSRKHSLHYLYDFLSDKKNSDNP